MEEVFEAPENDGEEGDDQDEPLREGERVFGVRDGLNIDDRLVIFRAGCEVA